MPSWTVVRAALDVSSPIAEALHRAIGHIPGSSEPSSRDPRPRSLTIGRIASAKAAAISASLALPPGPAGLLTLLPDLYLIWRVQGQMVSDIAAAYGKTAFLTREGMLYCLFKHGLAQALRHLVVANGPRLLIRRASLEVIQSVLRRVGISLSERMASKAVSRWIPVVGAMGVGAFAYYDTAQIARTAMEVFASDLAVEDSSAQASA